jgi:predicted esterase
MLSASLPHTKWVLPHAPQIPVTRHNGTILPAWFDVYALANLANSARDDETGILSTVAEVDALIQAEVDAGVPESRIVLGGFSQGGAVAAMSAVVGERDLAGVAVLSAWLPLSHKIKDVSAMERSSVVGSPNATMPLHLARVMSGPRIQCCCKVLIV